MSALVRCAAASADAFRSASLFWMSWNVTSTAPWFEVFALLVIIMSPMSAARRMTSRRILATDTELLRRTDRLRLPEVELVNLGDCTVFHDNADLAGGVHHLDPDL